MKILKIFGCALALFVGVNTEYFAQRGAIGMICYFVLVFVAVMCVMRRGKHESD